MPGASQIQRKIVVEYLGDVLLGPALVVSLPRPGGDFLRQEAFLLRGGPGLHRLRRDPDGG